MTYDKIKHHLGAELTKFIGAQDKQSLLKMKSEIIKDMNLNTLDSDILFKRTIELEFIKNLLN
jgi:hypothetical protein